MLGAHQTLESSLVLSRASEAAKPAEQSQLNRKLDGNLMADRPACNVGALTAAAINQSDDASIFAGSLHHEPSRVVRPPISLVI
jgi:hypothetical protein